MSKLLTSISTLMTSSVAFAHPGHHHGPSTPEIHGLFSWEQLVWVAILAVLIALYIRSK
jgi:hydrogenase/urease accessory protein HupE